MKIFTLCFTGLSGSGKTTLLTELDRILRERGVRIQTIDGDILRAELGHQFGYTPEEREKLGRVALLVAKYLNRNGVSIIKAGISGKHEERTRFRQYLGKEYIQVYLDCPIEECIRRDVKGYYKDISKLKNFVGIDIPYEVPTDSEIVVDTVHQSVEESVGQIMRYLEEHDFI